MMRKNLKNNLLFALLMLLNFTIVKAQNKSILYNGFMNYTTINNSADSLSKLNFTTDTFTIEAWVYPTSFANNTVANQHTILGNDSASFGVNSKGFAFCVSGDKKLAFCTSGTIGNFITTSPVVLVANQWQHIAVTKQKKVVTFYVNGMLYSASTLLGDSVIKRARKPLRIGENGNLNNRNFNGMIDELKIWDVSRTQTEVQQDMALTCTPFPIHLIAYFHMDDIGTIAPVRVKNEIDTLNNGTHNTSIVQQSGAFLFKGVTTLFVDSSNTNIGCNAQDGASWATAFSDLNDAIKVSHLCPSVSKIFVAKGTYHPTLMPFDMQSNKIGVPTMDTNNKNKTFHLRTSMEIYGGYPTGGGIRDWVLNPTILDASQVGGIIGDTACHIMIADVSIYWTSNIDSSKVDGFIFRNGRANFIYSLNFNSTGADQAAGGAIFIKHGLYAIRNCLFENNTSRNQGGAIHLLNSWGSLIENNRFIDNGNNSNGGGGAIFTSGSFFDIKNNLFKNCSSSQGGAINGNALGATNMSRIMNNTFEANYSYSDGGGALFGKYSMIKSNIFKKNRSGLAPNSGEGGAILSYQMDNDTITQNQFLENYSGFAAGAVYLFGGSNHLITQNVFFKDSAGSGGALYAVNTNTTVLDNTFKNCYASGDGGAVAINGSNQFFNQINNNVIDSNHAVRFGGGLYCYSSTDTITNNMITNNECDYYGGGLVINGVWNCFANNVVTNNKALNAGGMEVNCNTAYILNNVIANNTATVSTTGGYTAGGLYLDNGTIKVRNNLFWGNAYGNTNSTSLGADYFNYGAIIEFKNNIMQLASSNYTTIGSGQYDIGINASGNLFATNPLFVNSINPAGADNIFYTFDDGFRTLSTSPAIDLGDSTFLPSTINNDILSTDRIVGNNVDAGAYENNCIPTGNINSSNTILCPGSTAVLQVNAPAIATNMQWFFDSTSTTIMNTGYTYTTPILYNTDTFWVRNISCSNVKYPMVVNINTLAPIVTNATPSSNLQICKGSITQLNVVSNVIADSVKWYADSASNVVIDTGYIFTTPLINSKDTFWVNAYGCTSSTKIPIVVDVYPSTGVKTITTNCANYVWSINNQTYAATGTYYYNTINAFGCSENDTLILAIYPNSNTTSIINACDSYYWNNVNILYNNSGIYKDTLTNVYGCDSIITLNLTINTINNTVTQTGSLLTSLENGATYQWLNCPLYSLITGANNQNYTAISNGDYAVSITKNNCKDTSNCFTVSNVGINNSNILLDIFISPNPTNGIINISSQLPYSNSQLNIINAIGQIIVTKKLKNLNTNVDITNFAKGIYYIEIIAENKSIRTKLVKN